MIRIQREPFDVGAELAIVKAGAAGAGGTAVFIGTVRDVSEDAAVSAMTLEHYPGMTERALAAIEEEARSRWPLIASLVVHRYGRLEPGDDIVLVIAAASHREAAIEACSFLIDWLKTRAPFWKLEEGPEGAKWVEAKDTDEDAANRWSTKDRR